MDTGSKQNKNILLFLSSQTLSLFGSMLVQYAITWHITLETKSGVMMTLSIVCGFLPSFLISPFAGVWADRYSRKMLIILSDSLTALATLVLAVMFFLGYDSVWLLFTASAVRSLGSGIQTPAVGAFLPQIVPEEKLTFINGINGSIQSFVMLGSPLLSGVLMTFSTVDKIFFIDVATAAAAVFIMLVFLRVPVHAKASEKQRTGYFGDMLDGMRYIHGTDFLRRMFVFSAVCFVLLSPLSFLTPLQVARSFGGDVWRLTVIELTFSSGMMLGGIVIAVRGGFRNRIKTMALSVFIIAVCTLALGIVPFFPVYAAVMAVIGFSLPMFNTPFTVLLQEKVGGDFLGRVFGVLSMISASVMPLSMLLYGPLADFLKIEWLLIITGLLMAAAAVLLMRDKPLSDAGEPAVRNAAV